MIPGKVIEKGEKDRSYKILLENGQKIIRNRYHVFKGSKFRRFKIRNSYDYDDEDYDNIVNPVNNNYNNELNDEHFNKYVTIDDNCNNDQNYDETDYRE